MALTKVSRGLLSTSIVDNGNATAITIDANENVLVGTTTHRNFSGGTTEITVGTATTGATAGGAITFDSGSGFLGYLAFQESEGTLGTLTSVPLVFKTGNTERMRILSTGGITFNGDTAQANALDDYEEGTWNPTDASGAGLTITVNASSYTKIGNLCYIYAYITYPITSSTAFQTLGGLPFVTKSSNTYAQLTVRVVDNTVSENNLTFQTTTNSFVGSIHYGTTPIANVDLSGTSILISGVYATA